MKNLKLTKFDISYLIYCFLGSSAVGSLLILEHLDKIVNNSPRVSTIFIAISVVGVIAMFILGEMKWIKGGKSIVRSVMRN